MSDPVTLILLTAGEVMPNDFAVLDDDERDRADRLTVDLPRRAFVAAHAALRRSLAARLDTDPEALRFSFGPHGKPDLDPPRSVRFNLSHSGSSVAIALGEGGDLGVDLEELGRDTPTERLAQRFFTPAEAAAVAAAPTAERNRVFFHCWTAKEAVLKATGSGLTVPVREVEVDPDPDAPPRVLSLGGDAAEAARWTLLRHEVPGKLIVTVAFLGARRELVVRGTSDS